MGAAPADEKTIGLGRSPSGSAPSDIQVGGVAASDSGAGVVTQYGETKRGLSPRHVQLMAIGGSIGTGLCKLTTPFPRRFTPPRRLPPRYWLSLICDAARRYLASPSSWRVLVC